MRPFEWGLDWLPESGDAPDTTSFTAPEIIGAHPVAPFLHLFAERSHLVEQAVPPVAHVAPNAHRLPFAAM